QLFKDRPIVVAAGGAEFAFEMALQIGLDPVVVQQCIVDIDQEDDRLGTCHGKYSGGAQDSRMRGSRSASDRATIGKLRAPAYLPYLPSANCLRQGRADSFALHCRG